MEESRMVIELRQRLDNAEELIRQWGEELQTLPEKRAELEGMKKPGIAAFEEMNLQIDKDIRDNVELRETHLQSSISNEKKQMQERVNQARKENQEKTEAIQSEFAESMTTAKREHEEKIARLKKEKTTNLFNFNKKAQMFKSSIERAQSLKLRVKTYEGELSDSSAKEQYTIAKEEHRTQMESVMQASRDKDSLYEAYKQCDIDIKQSEKDHVTELEGMDARYNGELEAARQEREGIEELAQIHNLDVAREMPIGEEKPAEGKEEAAEGKEEVAEGEEKKAEGEEKAAEGEEKAAEGEEKAAEGEEKPAEEEKGAGAPGVVPPGAIRPGAVRPGAVRPGPVKTGSAAKPEEEKSVEGEEKPAEKNNINRPIDRVVIGNDGSITVRYKDAVKGEKPSKYTFDESLKNPEVITEVAQMLGVSIDKGAIDRVDPRILQAYKSNPEQLKAYLELCSTGKSTKTVEFGAIDYELRDIRKKDVPMDVDQKLELKKKAEITRGIFEDSSQYYQKGVVDIDIGLMDRAALRWEIIKKSISNWRNSRLGPGEEQKAPEATAKGEKAGKEEDAQVIEDATKVEELNTEDGRSFREKLGEGVPTQEEQSQTVQDFQAEVAKAGEVLENEGPDLEEK